MMCLKRLNLKALRQDVMSSLKGRGLQTGKKKPLTQLLLLKLMA